MYVCIPLYVCIYFSLTKTLKCMYVLVVRLSGQIVVRVENECDSMYHVCLCVCVSVCWQIGSGQLGDTLRVLSGGKQAARQVTRPACTA